MARKVVGKAARETDGRNAERIRKYKESHPDAMPREIAEVLTGQGYHMSAAYVSSILHVDKLRREKRSSMTQVERLMAAKELVEELGGEGELRDLLSRIEAAGGTVAIRAALEWLSKLR